MLRTFGSSEPEIALRAYLYLIGAVAFRRSVSYGELAWQIKRGGPNPLAKPLELLTRWCKTNGLPALTSLVVQEATGLPAPGFTAVSRSEIPDEQKRVWDYDWFAILPPTVEELKT
jgi:hypothetical protein